MPHETVLSVSDDWLAIRERRQSIPDREALFASYEAVREDKDATEWATYGYEGNNVVPQKTGNDYAELIKEFTEDARVYAYARFETGDELSKRSKFALITWVGSSVGPLKKAKMSTDKADVKSVIRDFAIEVLADSLEEVEHGVVLQQVIKSGGANYGNGVRSDGTGLPTTKR